MARSRNNEMPNLFVIGAARCGTTSLHHYLGLHPEISMSRIKEPRYFAFTPGSEQERGITDRRRYLALFDPDTPIRGESSPAYSSFPRIQQVPSRIAEQTEEARFIYLVRDPIERIESSLRMWAAEGRFENPPDGEPLSDLPTEDLVSSSRYMTQISQYLRFFPDDSVLVVDTRCLAERRRNVLALVFDFLGVDPDFDHPGFSRKLNRGDSFATLPPLLNRIPGSFVAKMLKSVTGARRSRRARTWISREIGAPVAPIRLTPGLKDAIRTDLASEVEGLRSFTGQEFTSWSL